MSLQTLVKNIERVNSKIPEILVPLMAPRCEKIDEMVSPGLTLLRWTSLNLEYFTISVENSLKELDLLIDRINDILEIQIEEVLRGITSTLLRELPGNEPWTIEEFVSRIKVVTYRN